jgi:glycerate-2-kinase
LRIQNADVLTSHGNLPGRQAVLEILEAGLQAADPYLNTRRLIRVEKGRLLVGNPAFEPAGDPRSGFEVFDLSQVGRIFVFGAGKGIQYAARAFEDVLGERLAGGHVIAKHGDEQILERIGVTYGAHPVPDEGCVEGCRRILQMCQDLRPEDLVFTLVGNGVSALLTLPAPGISLEEIRQVTYLMQIERGAPTQDLNPVRNHLDAMKSGRISRMFRHLKAVHILVFDANAIILPDKKGGLPCGGYKALMRGNLWLHTLPDCTTFADAARMLKKWHAWEEVPEGVRAHLLRADPAQETVKAGEWEQADCRVFGVMPASLGMVPAAKKKAAELGFKPHTLSTFLQAEAREAGFTLADLAINIEKECQPFEPPCALFTSGELLVTVGGEHGIGGRNQEFALAAALRLDRSQRIVVGAVDSDGTDGPGGQFWEGRESLPCLAGGLVDGSSAETARAAGVDLHAALRRHDASPALWKLGDGVLLSHNVSMGDLSVILVMRNS